MVFWVTEANSLMPNTSLFNQYELAPRTWDEMYEGDQVRGQYQKIFEYLQSIPADELSKKEELAKKLFMSQGITFTVYSSGEGIEKIFPFDIIPRIITASEWSFIENGIKQRLRALNLFLKDVYHQQFILKDGIVPIDLIYPVHTIYEKCRDFPFRTTSMYTSQE